MALKILLADDSMTAQNMGKKILTDAGYEVVAVSNGAAAVKKIAEISPQLCILDIYMPGYTGLEVCEKIKSNTATARMPVLLTVGKMEPYKPEEGARVRADGVIVKPFEASELLRAVHRFSQRIAGAAPVPPRPVTGPTQPPASTPSTYERTVKLTREQIQEYMEPGQPSWKGGTAAPDNMPSAAARIEMPVEVGNVAAFNVENLVANTVTASTADAMPTFAVRTAVAEQESPAAIVASSSANVDVATPVSVAVQEMPAEEAPPPIVEVPLANAAAVLPGFVDYLIAQPPSNGAKASIDAEGSASVVAAEAEALQSVVVPAVETAVEAPLVESAGEPVVAQEPVAEGVVPEPTMGREGEFAVTASPVEHVEATETSAIPLEPQIVQAVESEHSTGTEMLSDELKSAHKIGHEIPAVDPALEIAPSVAIDARPDPQFEAPQELHVANATAEGLETTSRAAESAGVTTTADPNLAPMEGLTDAVHPLEGGRLIVPSDEAPQVVGIAEHMLVEPPVASLEGVPVAEIAPVEDAGTTIEAAPVVEPVVEAAVVAEAAPIVEAATSNVPVVEDPVPAPVVEAPPPSSSKKSKKGMRAIPAGSQASKATEGNPQPVVEAKSPSVEAKPEVAAAAKTDVTEEIAAVLDLLGQTTAATIPVAEPGAVASAAVEETSQTPVILAPRVWMAEEVALSEVEATISLENEMRLAYAPTIVDPETAPEPEACSPVMEPRAEAAVVTAPAEEPVRDDKIAPQAAMSETGGSPPESTASPTQELAAAMAAAFGGALPKEDLARAEETQSISEEVRRFALGDAYKPKATFGGAAIDDPAEKVLDSTKLAAAVSRALDRLKPQLIAEILKELEAMDGK